MRKGRKILAIIIAIILAIVIGIVTVYFISFKPKTPTIPVTTNIQINELDLVKKFIPTDVDLNFKGISVTSDTSFSSEELTNLGIYAINQSPEAKKYVTGLKVSVEGKDIVIYVTTKYKEIPFEIKLIFKPYAKDGMGIFHYVSGNIGFIQIPKDIIFDKLSNNSLIQFNKTNGDILLHFAKINEIKIENIYTKEDNINIIFKGSVNFF